MFIGFAIAAVGVLALISLWHGNPRPFGGYGRLSGAAGITGALASWPLGKLVSGIGVAIVWGGAVLLGLLIFTGDPALGDLGTDRRRVHPRGRRRGPRGRGRRARTRRRPPSRGSCTRATTSRWSSCRRTTSRRRSPRRSRCPSWSAPTGRRAVRAPAARPAPDARRRRPRATRDEEHTEGRARTHVPHLRRAGPRRGRAPRPDRDDVRGRGRGGHQGQQGPVARRRHRLRARHARRADHRADPGQVGDRRRGAEQGPRLRDARRRPAFEGRDRRRTPAGGRARQGRPRPRAAGEPGGDAARADRRGDRRRQVEPDQLVRHLDPDARRPRRGQARARRPQAGRARRTSPTCRTCSSR